jgi:uncharacterized protein (DUF924 family)
LADVATAEEVVAFWCAAGKDRWFEANAEFDAAVRDRFLATHEAAAAGRLARWPQTPEGALALLLLLDQFPRNMFRGAPRAFATDREARRAAQVALDRGFDRQVDLALRTFFYVPFMHSEKLADQEHCLPLYRAHGDTEGIRYAEIHLDAIRRFGRFPHRNAILGRTSTAEEIAYFEGGGFGG